MGHGGAGLGLLVLLAAATTALASARSAVTGRVVTLTELNFDELVSTGEPWMIDIYAPWCPACQEMESAWHELAEVLDADGVHVGKIDGTRERGLLSRFSVQHFPSIYHVVGKETREYEGPRSVEAMAAFARGGWRDVAPRRGCTSPVSTCGWMLGEVTKVPARAKSYYFHLHDDKGWGELPLFAGMLAVPLAIGLTAICVMDAYYTRRPLGPIRAAHVHQE